MHWDFISLTPESIQNIMFLFSDRGVPASYKHMDGFGASAYKWVNEQGEAFLIKYHIKADLKHKPLLPDQVKEVEKRTYDYLQEDLFNTLAKGESITWTFNIQVMPEKDADTYRYDVTDITKIWPHGDYPLIPVGKLVMNRNPENYHAQVE